jgi:hypothetical protein
MNGEQAKGVIISMKMKRRNDVDLVPLKNNTPKLTLAPSGFPPPCSVPILQFCL